jgi:hypothetical protein
MAEDGAGTGAGEGRDVLTVCQMEKGPTAARDDFLNMVLVLVPAIMVEISSQVDGDPIAKQSFERVERPVGSVGRIAHRISRIGRVD